MICRLSCRHSSPELSSLGRFSQQDHRFSHLLIILAVFISALPLYGQARLTLKTVEVTGNKSFPTREVGSWLMLTPGSPYTVEALHTSVTRLIGRYREEGFYSASIGSITTRLDRDSTEAEVLIHLHEGERTELGAIQLHGNHALSTEHILSGFETKTGVPLKQLQLESDIGALLQSYEKMGYPFARVEIESLKVFEADGERRLKLDLSIKEGSLTRIEEVKIEGNKDTKNVVILRELRITPGQPYNHQKVQSLRKKLERLNLFSSVNEPELFVGSKGGGLLIKVQEGNTNSFDGIVGYVPKGTREESGYFTGFVNIALRNLFGTGRRLAARWQRENQSTQEVELRYLEPWVLNLPVNVGVGFLQREQDSSYIRRRFDFKGDALLTDEFSVSLLFGQDRIIPSATISAPLLSRSTTTTLGGEIRYDSRDDAYSPTSGILYRSDYRIGGKSLSASGAPNESFVVKKFGVDLEFYIQPFSRQVISTGLHASDLRSDHIEEGDLYRFGGTNTLRGYRENQFLGSSIAWSNLEYRFLMARRSFFYGFLDTGYYFRPADPRRGTPSSDAFRVGYGVGFRVQTSIGLLGASLALGRGDTFSTGKIHFGIINQF